MKWSFARTLVLFALFGSIGAAAGLAGAIDPNLQTVLDKAGDQEIFSVMVFMADRVDVNAMSAQLKQGKILRKERHETVVRALQARAAQTQSDLLARLNAMKADNSIEHFEAFWIANCIRLDATAATIRQIAQRSDVETVYPNYSVELIEPTQPPTAQAQLASPPEAPHGSTLMPTPEMGVQAVRAPEVWSMGITGAGVLVATLDTGVDGNHPALASRWRGVADPRYAGHPGWALFDPVTHWTFPQDSGYHGTHTMGTVCGGAPGNQTGVAPGAQWIHAAVIDRTTLLATCTDAILAFQWLIDPDGDPSTVWDVPQVCSNSWGIGSWHDVPPYNAPCDDAFWSYIDACEAAGIVILFSAGNEGPTVESLRRPGDRAVDDYHNCAVGGINANSPPNWFMYSSSSRGPSHCTPTGVAAIKPDIAAPAEDVVSCMPGNSYGSLSGTSMASPHVNGVVALIMEACPDLYPDEVKQIIYDTALDLGPAGKDNDYGYGLIDAYEAVNLALGMCSGVPRAHDVNAETPANTDVAITLDARDYDQLPNPPGTLTYIVTSLPAHGSLVDPGADLVGDVPYVLVDGGNQVIYRPAPWYVGADGFAYKANDGGVPPDGGDSEPANVSIDVLIPAPSTAYFFDLGADPGWTAEGQWAYGPPTGDGTHNRDPLAGHTGPNVYGFNLAGDYPNDMPLYTLTTTAIDCRNVTAAQLSFWRWLGIEKAPHDNAGVQVSNDGVNWTTVWHNSAIIVSDAAWTQTTYNISAIADRQPTVYVRWTMGPTDYNVTYPGWNIDDVEIRGIVLPLCGGDLDGDNAVGLPDLARLLAHYGMTGTTYNDGDIDGDGDVDISDLSALLSVYGTNCP